MATTISDQERLERTGVWLTIALRVISLGNYRIIRRRKSYRNLLLKLTRKMSFTSRQHHCVQSSEINHLILYPTTNRKALAFIVHHHHHIDMILCCGRFLQIQHFQFSRVFTTTSPVVVCPSLGEKRFNKSLYQHPARLFSSLHVPLLTHIS